MTGRVCLAVCLAFAGLPTTALAAEIEKVKFPDQLQVADRSLTLNNVGLAYYKVVFKALVAGLYLEEGARPEDALADVGKRLEIQYFWAIKAKDIVAASEKLLVSNVSREQREALQDEIAQMHALYQDVKPGDRYALTYLPGRGTMLTLNDKSLGVVPGAEFPAAYFSIWLGDKPMDAALKKQLLRR